MSAPRKDDTYLEVAECTSCHDVTEVYAGRNGWRGRCRKCNSRNSADIKKRCNDDTLDHADHHRQEWTTEEMEFVTQMTAEGETYRSIAYALGRTMHAVRAKTHEMRGTS